LARVVIRVVTFTLRVQGASPPPGSTVVIASPDPNAVISVIATLDPPPFCVPKDLVRWDGGDPLPDPLRRTVSRQRIAVFDVRANLMNTTRAVQIRIARTVVSANNDPFGDPIDQVRIQGLLDTDLRSVHRGVLFPSQTDSLFRVRADIPGVPPATRILRATLRSLDASNGLVESLDIELSRSPSTSDHFLSPRLLVVPRAIPRVEIRMRANPDLAVVRAAAGGSLQVQVTADVPLGAQGRTEVTMRGRVNHLFAIAFDGSGIDAATIRQHIEETDRIWAQAGIEVRAREVRDGVSEPDLVRLDHADDTGQTLTLEQQRLVGRRAPSPPASAVVGDINVYYVEEIVEVGGPGSATIVGGIAFPNDPVIAMDVGRVDGSALAHELGHQLFVGWGNDHQDRSTGLDWPARNVMHPATAGGTDLHRDQVSHILSREPLGIDPFVIFEP
jgi:hypothetical protein